MVAKGADRPLRPRVVRRRGRLLEELTDDVEPDDDHTVGRRLLSMLLLIVTIGLLAASVAFVISRMLARSV